MRQAWAVATIAIGVLPAVAGCGARDRGMPEGGIRNPALGIAITELPEPFRLEENGAATIRLAVDDREGEVVIDAAPPPESGGVNLVEAVHEKQAEFEAKPGGEYLGTQELILPTGPAFTARGRYLRDAREVEEIWVLTLHPQEQRMLRIVYRYPFATDSRERAQQLLDLLAEIGGAMPEGEG